MIRECQMIDVYKIGISKDKLLAMPDDERALFLLLGYAANQINFFMKLVVFSTNRDGDGELEQTLSAAQSQMALRVVIGVLNETWRLIHSWFLSARCGKLYAPKLDQEGVEALGRLKKELDASDGLFSKLRSNWIFHHPHNDELTEAFNDAVASKDWNQLGQWYFSESNYNSFYLANEFVALHGILKFVGEPDLESGQQKLTERILSVAEDMSIVIQAIAVVLWRQHFGPSLNASETIQITNAPGFRDPWIPFFTEGAGET